MWKKWKSWHAAKYGDPYTKIVQCISPIQVRTHRSEHTHIHREQTPKAVSSQLAPVNRCLVQYHLSHSNEGGQSSGYSLLPPTNPARAGNQTCDFWNTSPTLWPLGHDNLKKWLPHLPWQITEKLFKFKELQSEFLLFTTNYSTKQTSRISALTVENNNKTVSL